MHRYFRGRRCISKTQLIKLRLTYCNTDILGIYKEAKTGVCKAVKVAQVAHHAPRYVWELDFHHDMLRPARKQALENIQGADRHTFSLARDSV